MVVMSSTGVPSVWQECNPVCSRHQDLASLMDSLGSFVVPEVAIGVMSGPLHVSTGMSFPPPQRLVGLDLHYPMPDALDRSIETLCLL